MQNNFITDKENTNRGNNNANNSESKERFVAVESHDYLPPLK